MLFESVGCGGRIRTLVNGGTHPSSPWICLWRQHWLSSLPRPSGGAGLIWLEKVSGNCNASLAVHQGAVARVDLRVNEFELLTYPYPERRTEQRDRPLLQPQPRKISPKRCSETLPETAALWR